MISIKDFLYILICSTGFFAIISIMILFFAIINLNGWMFFMSLIPTIGFISLTMASIGWFNEHSTEKPKKN